MFRRVTLIQFLAIASVIAISAAALGQQCEATELAKLLASDGESGDEFRWAVAISGDTAVVGAYLDAGGGSAYVFVWDGSSWSQAAKLTACDAENGDGIGGRVG